MNNASMTISMRWTDTRLLLLGGALTFLVAFAAFSALLGGPNGPAVFLAGAAASLWATGCLLWLSARGLSAVTDKDEQLEAEAVVGRRRKELSREYHLLKRALKELELDRQMGKLSEADYADIRSLYRTRAVRILKVLDEREAAVYADRIEADVQKLRAKSAQKPSHTSPANKAEERPTILAKACSECGTRNDLDAVFCKQCGEKIGGMA
jgi:ribosomal protein L40E